ncbi:MAG: stalk domain-containing protein [Peptoniphilus harei]|nr:stalk domain-containing protein [Peptoniphilus harei]MDU5466486.1 stalk domain-containing protein [Peptoniphilus harei]
MKKVVATTMATLLFGLSFPAKSFALPNNTEELESKIVEDFNVKKYSEKIIDKDPNLNLAEENNGQNPNQGQSLAERIGKNKLISVDISLWQGDPINWKDGVKLDTSVNDPELRKAFDEAKFEGEGRNSNNQRTSGEEGKIKVTFSDNSFIEVLEHKLYVFPHVTASTYANTPKDAVTTTFFLGEGSKVKSGLNEQVGNGEHPIPLQTYKIKPGTNIHDFQLPTNKNIFDNISAMPADDSYSNLKWDPENYTVNETNKSFTARAIKSFNVKFEFKAYDSDKGNEEINSLPQELMDKMPKDLKVKKGDSFEAIKPENFVETIKDKAGEVIKVYEWTFAGWNPTKFLKVEKDEKISGTWKRKQATSIKASVNKISEGDKVIKGQGITGSTINIYLREKKILEAKVSDRGNWEVKLDRKVKKGDKLYFTQIEKGKKESDKVESNVVEKNKPSPKPNPNPNPNPDQKPNQKPSPNKRPSTGNIFPKIKNRDYNKNSIEVKTYLAKSKINENKNKGLRHIINVLSGEYEFVKDGVSQKKRMDVVPVLKNDRLMLPLRSLAEMIGAKVEWDPTTRIATFTNNSLVAKIQIDGDEILLSNGKVIKMDSKPLNINGRILVSISNVGNVFGLTNGNTKDGIDQDIEWDDANKTVTINLKK